MTLFALLDQTVTVFTTSTPDLFFYGGLFIVLAGAVAAVAVLMRNNASHSIGSMRSETSGHPHVPSGGRFSGPAIHGRW